MNINTIRNKINNDKGSTLVMLLIIVVIFTMLGTAILSLAISNYKMKKVQSNEKKNFYFAESGLDEAYGIMGGIVDKAIEEGNKAVTDYMENDLSPKINDILTFMKAGEEIPIEYNDYLNFVNDDGSFNMNEIAIAQNIKFQETFTSYVTSTDYNMGDLFNKLDDEANYDDEYDTNLQIDVFPLTYFNVEEGQSLVFSLRSTFDNEGIEKKLSAKFEIKIPEYNTPYFTYSDVASVKKNLAWTKSIAAEGDLKVFGGNAVVYGDVYVKGNNDTFGGVSTMLDYTNLIVEGNISSMKNVQTASSNSKVEVKGNIYADDVLIARRDEGGTSIQSSTLDVRKNASDTGSVYTFDDLSLNGTKSTINIENNYYGVSDGTASSEPDHSSSIVINTEDIGITNGSSLTIGNDVFIAGTSYISVLYEGNKYQTGESVSVKGNYRAYGSKFTEIPDGLVDPEDPIRNQTYWERFLSDNVNFEYYEPLNLAHSFVDDGLTFDLNNKIDYFMFYGKTDENKLNLGGTSGIDIDGNNLIHVGALINNGQIQNTSFSSGDEGTRKTLEEIYLREAHYMGADETLVSEDDLSTETGEAKTVSYWVNFSNLPIPDVTPTVDSNRELILLDSSNTDYAIKGLNSSDTPHGVEEIDLGSNKKVMGLIITEGDVYLLGEIEFTGTIITNGNVYIRDNFDKEIKYDEKYVAFKIAENSHILNIEGNEVFNPQGNNGTSIEIILDSSIGHTDTPYTDIVRDKLINIRNWSIVK